MVKAKGPVWHKKQKEAGIIPDRLRGLDKQATWSFSMADRWVYGHGTFCIATHDTPVVGAFKWMRNSAHEAKRMRQEIWSNCKILKYVCMDSKADDQKLYFDLKKVGTQLLTTTRKKFDKTPGRKKMIAELKKRKNRQEYKKRSITVEPIQGLINEIFELERCWMRGNENNRWLFASMGIAVQMAQLEAYRLGKSTWCIKDEVLGL